MRDTRDAREMRATHARRASAVAIGKIVRSESHVRYTCQVYGPGETSAAPSPSDYAFGAFVRIPLRAGAAQPDSLTPAPGDVAAVAPGANWAIGLIYDTILLNPAFGALGPRLSNDEQVELFSPDYVVERAVLVSILLLGAASAGRAGGDGERGAQIAHGVPALAPDLGAVVSPLDDGAIRAFHYFSDEPHGQPYLHMGYLPHAVAQDNPLLPMAILRVIERLEALFPEQRALLSIVKRNFAWRLKVQSAG